MISQPVLPFLTGNAVTRTTPIFAQFSAHSWHLSPDVTLEEIRSADSLSFNELLHQLAYGETQQGAPANSLNYPLAIGWGRRDLVCFPVSGTASEPWNYFPMRGYTGLRTVDTFRFGDVFQETVRLIRGSTSSSKVSEQSARC